MSKFQLILTAVLGLSILAGAIAFATIKRGGSAQDAQQITVWGTVSNSIGATYFGILGSSNRKTVNVKYTFISPETFEQNLIEALADGKGPDGIILPDNLIYRLKDKLYTVPFTNYSERSFKDSFVNAEEIYLSPNGIIGFPLSIDPIVMYWNRDLLAGEGFSKPPASWSELFLMAPKLTKKDAAGNITQSTIALGDLSNVAHGKEILATLMFQAGIPIVNFDGLRMRSAIQDRSGSIIPGEEAVRFFTEFVNPSKDSYSWNKSLSNSYSTFIGGRLALYIGFASEYNSIRQKNPNLNFDVAIVPQSAGATIPATYGSSLAFSILKTSRNIPAAALAFSTLSGVDGVTEWVKETGLPPARRDLLSNSAGIASSAVFNRSALISRTWLDPNPKATQVIFTKMIESVASGKTRISGAVSEASSNLNDLLK